jgi:hypothetical protein
MHSTFASDIHQYVSGINPELEIMSSNVVDGSIIDVVDHQLKVALNLIPLDGKTNHQKGKLTAQSIDAHGNGYALYHVYESEWIHRRKVLTKKIDSLLRLNLDAKKSYRAYKCEVRKISEETFRAFVRQNSISVVPFSDTYYGMYPMDKDDPTLLSVMSVKAVKSDPRGIILTSFCSSLDHRVAGAFGKFVAYLQSQRAYCVYHADLRWLDLTSNFITKCGMKFVRPTEPLTFAYLPNVKKLHLVNGITREGVLSKITLERVYNDQLTPEQNLLENGYKFIHDAGCMVFTTK